MTVGVTVGVAVGVTVGVAVGVFVGVCVGVFVGVTVGVLVGVSVGVLVGVKVGGGLSCDCPACAITTSGALGLPAHPGEFVPSVSMPKPPAATVNGNVDKLLSYTKTTAVPFGRSNPSVGCAAHTVVKAVGVKLHVGGLLPIMLGPKPNA